jgi:PST family polysaccharide transporter
MSSLGARAARGAFVTVGAQGIRMVLQLVTITILARLLTPDDYGLLAMVVVIIGIGEMVRDFGLSTAAIRAPTLSEGERSKLFWINTAIGLGLAALVAAGAELVARLYDQPELVGITRALALTFLLNGAATQYRADLTRKMRFRALAVVDVLTPALALGVAVTAALAGAGYWALVAQYLAQAAVGLVAVVVATRWLPSLPSRSVPVRHFFVYGGNLLGAQLIGYLGKNIDTFVIGLRFGPQQLGAYNRAWTLLMTPLVQIRAPTTTVALPVLSKVRDEPARTARFLCTGQKVLAYPVTVGLAVVIGAAEPLIDVLLGPGWEQVPAILRPLAVAGAFQTIAYVSYWVYLSRGLTPQLLRYSVAETAVRVACVLAGATWGVVGVAAGYAAAAVVLWPLSFLWLVRLTPLPLRELFTGAARVLATAAATCAAAAAATSALSGERPLVQLLAAVGAGAGAVALLVVAARPVRRDVAEIAGVVARAARRRGGAAPPAAGEAPRRRRPAQGRTPGP